MSRSRAARAGGYGTLTGRLVWPVALLAAAAVLLTASTSSPLYATNFWTDTNIYFTIGRGIRHGLMPYRDLFDHKGPLLYLLYALGALISEKGFIGVFALEALSLGAALRMVAALAADGRREAGWCALAILPAAALCACCSRAFTQGGSAEEFCLPALTLGLLSAVRFMQAPDDGTGRRWAAAFGGAAAWVFLIKYTDCGLFFGLGPLALLAVLRRRGCGAALGDALAMLGGFAALTALCSCWLLFHGILRDCVRVYFLQNLFEYSGAPMTLKGHLWNALAYLRTQGAANPALALLTLAGMAGWALRALLLRRPGWLFEALALPAGAGLLLLFCYWGEMAHPYYALVFAAPAWAGLAALAAGLSGLTRSHAGRSGKLVLLAGLACILPVTARLCPSRAMRQVRREEMPQAVFAAEMRALSPDPTLLDLTSLDQGFYLALGRLPTVRYFADNNLDTPEKREAIAGYLSGQVCEFVVTVWKTPGEGYEAVDRREGVFDLNDRRTYTLWRRTPARQAKTR